MKVADLVAPDAKDLGIEMPKDAASQRRVCEFQLRSVPCQDLSPAGLMPEAASVKEAV